MTAHSSATLCRQFAQAFVDACDAETTYFGNETAYLLAMEFLHAPRSEMATTKNAAPQEEHTGRLWIPAVAGHHPAVAALRKVITDAQEILATYIVPDSGISEHECVNQLLGLLDGPQTRGALSVVSASSLTEGMVTGGDGTQFPGAYLPKPPVRWEMNKHGSIFIIDSTGRICSSDGICLALNETARSSTAQPGGWNEALDEAISICTEMNEQSEVGDAIDMILGNLRALKRYEPATPSAIGAKELRWVPVTERCPLVDTAEEPRAFLLANAKIGAILGAGRFTVQAGNVYKGTDNDGEPVWQIFCPYETSGVSTVTLGPLEVTHWLEGCPPAPRTAMDRSGA